MNQNRTYLERVLKHLEIVDVIGEYLQLEDHGNKFIARCPFHFEQTPSFVVNPHDQTFYCLSCGKKGDAIDFLREIHQLLGALRELDHDEELNDKEIISCSRCLHVKNHNV